jgi:hypothetical protein
VHSLRSAQVVQQHLGASGCPDLEPGSRQVQSPRLNQVEDVPHRLQGVFRLLPTPVVERLGGPSEQVIEVVVGDLLVAPRSHCVDRRDGLLDEHC